MSESCPVHMDMAAARDTPARAPGSVPGISPGTAPLTSAHLSPPPPGTKPAGWEHGSLLVGIRPVSPPAFLYPEPQETENLLPPALRGSGKWGHSVQLQLSERVPAVPHICSHEGEGGHGKGTVWYDFANDYPSDSLALLQLLRCTWVFLQACTQMPEGMWHVGGAGAPAQVLTGVCTPHSVPWTRKEQSSSLTTVISP